MQTCALSFPLYYFQVIHKFDLHRFYGFHYINMYKDIFEGGIMDSLSNTAPSVQIPRRILLRSQDQACYDTPASWIFLHIVINESWEQVFYFCFGHYETQGHFSSNLKFLTLTPNFPFGLIYLHPFLLVCVCVLVLYATL